jgi:AraC family transcriptional regulator
MLSNIRIQRYAPGLTQAPHRHDSASVTLLLRGQLRERSAGTEVAADPLSLVVKPAGVVHANHFGPSPVATCQIELDPSRLEQSRWNPSLQRWRWIVGGRAVHAAVQLAQLIASNADVDEVHEMAEAVLDGLDAQPASRTAPGWLHRALELIEDELATGVQRIRVAHIAAVLDLHPVHLARVFHRQLGMPVLTWIRRRRVQRAASRMGATAETLSETAAATGFADHSHMNRTFHRESGMLPGSYRSLIRAL